jgi:DNA helicase-2/ATP-dependent DNA helicase PcrA
VWAERILLLTFTRRAADVMLARANALARSAAGAGRPWGGTFHAIAYRLVAVHAEAFGLPGVSVVDPADATVTMDLLRQEHQQLVGTDVRLPRSLTLVEAVSRAVNTGRPLRAVLDVDYPWCAPHADAIVELARGYVARKRERGLLDFDDLLLAWRALLADPTSGPAVRGLWDYVLVDEYQDVNQLQVDIVAELGPDGIGLTVVGDDAQSIYGFRGCDPAHLHSLAARFPTATVVKLERNYRSRQPILDLANAARPDRAEARLHLDGVRGGGPRPLLVSCHDAAEEARTVVDGVLAAAADGVGLRDQAVLMRAAHHSDLLELELTARRIPFRKYGGLKFLEAAHVKDYLATIRVLINPSDDVSWFRLLRLHQGIGSAHAHRVATTLTGTASPVADRHADAIALAPAKPGSGCRRPCTGSPRPRERPPQRGRRTRCCTRCDRSSKGATTTRRRGWSTSPGWSTPPPTHPTSRRSRPNSPSTRPSRPETSPVRRTSTRTTWCCPPCTPPRAWNGPVSTSSGSSTAPSPPTWPSARPPRWPRSAVCSTSRSPAPETSCTCTSRCACRTTGTAPTTGTPTHRPAASSTPSPTCATTPNEHPPDQPQPDRRRRLESACRRWTTSGRDHGGPLTWVCCMTNDVPRRQDRAACS